MKIIPLQDAVVIELLKTERKTKGGIVIPDTEAEKYDQANVKATIIAIGPLAFLETMEFEKEFNVNCVYPKVGDTVAVAKYAGAVYKVDDKEYKLVRGSDIGAILDE